MLERGHSYSFADPATASPDDTFLLYLKTTRRGHSIDSSSMVKRL